MKKKLLALVAAFTFLLCMLPSFLLPTRADANDYIVDEYGLLTNAEIQALNNIAKDYSDKYKIGFYIRIMNSHGSQTIEQYSKSIFNSEDLGIGDEKEGIMLTLTMEDHKFDITVHGKKANKIFDARARENIASAVVYDHLKYNEYGEGAKVFLDEYSSTIVTPYIIKGSITVIVPLIISIVTILFFRSKHKTKGISHEAYAYIPQGGLKLQRAQDMYLYRSETRTYNPPAKSSGGSGGFHSSSSGGFGHTSGHF